MTGWREWQAGGSDRLEGVTDRGSDRLEGVTGWRE